MEAISRTESIDTYILQDAVGPERQQANRCRSRLWCQSSLSLIMHHHCSNKVSATRRCITMVKEVSNEKK